MKKLKRMFEGFIGSDVGTVGGRLSPDKNLLLNFRNVPLETIFEYLSRAAGFFFRVRPNVNLKTRVNIRTEGPLDKEEVLALLQRVLQDIRCTAIRDGRMLTIIRSEDAKKSYLPLGHWMGVEPGLR